MPGTRFKVEEFRLVSSLSWIYFFTYRFSRMGPNYILYQIYILSSRFPIRGRLVVGHLGKMAKNCIEITKSTFFGQNSWEAWREKSIFWVVRGNPRSLLHLGKPCSYIFEQHHTIYHTTYQSIFSRVCRFARILSLEVKYDAQASSTILAIQDRWSVHSRMSVRVRTRG